MPDNDETMQLIEDCETRESKLTDREREFIDSIKRQLEGGATLSSKQSEWLGSIWNRVTSRG